MDISKRARPVNLEREHLQTPGPRGKFEILNNVAEVARGAGAQRAQASSAHLNCNSCTREHGEGPETSHKTSKAWKFRTKYKERTA